MAETLITSQTAADAERGSGAPLDYQSAPPQPSVKRLALQGSIWMGGTFAAGTFLRLGSNLLLTRLLFPDAFGLAALVSVILLGLTLFSDVGIGPSIIQHPRGTDPVFLNTAWTIQAIRGLVLSALAALLAVPLAHFFEQPALAWLLPVGCLSAAIAGFNSTGFWTENRQMRVGRMSAIELIAQAAAAAVMVVWAWLSPSVWALVSSMVVNAAVKMVLSHVMIRGVQPRFVLERASCEALLHFGKWVFLSTVLTFFALQLDRLMLGKFVPMGMLGVYSIAMMLATFPRDVYLKLVVFVLYPALAQQARGDEARMEEKLLAARAVLVPVTLIAMLWVAIGAPVFFGYCYDARYMEAGWICQYLVVYFWFVVLQGSADRALLAMGDAKSLTISNFVNVVVTATACPAGFYLGGGLHGHGMVGFLLGLICSSLAGHMVIQVALARRGIRIVQQDVAYTLIGGALGTLAVLGPMVAARLGSGPWERIGAVGVAGGVLGTATLVMAWRVLPRLRTPDQPARVPGGPREEGVAT